jgi:hypothetical protein
VLLAYCAGLIAVCTGLLIIATVLTIQNYWMLRKLLDGASPGKHDPRPVHEQRSVHYDSGPPVPDDVGPRASDDIEWTGPVTEYTPAARKRE